MSDEAAIEQTEPPVLATPEWIGRRAMVTMDTYRGNQLIVEPWYDGVVTAVSELRKRKLLVQYDKILGRRRSLKSRCIAALAAVGSKFVTQEQSA